MLQCFANHIIIYNHPSKGQGTCFLSALEKHEYEKEKHLNPVLCFSDFVLLLVVIC